MRKDEANKEQNVTFTSHLHTNTLRASQHIYVFFGTIASVVQIQITKFATYMFTWQTQVNPFFLCKGRANSRNVSLRNSEPAVHIINSFDETKLSCFRSCEATRKKT